MGMMVDNRNFSIRFSLTCLKLCGLWAPSHLDGWKKTFYHCYGVFIFMLILGSYVAIQMVDLYMIWGDIPLMTSTACLLFTNLVHTVKVLNLVIRRRRIEGLVQRNNRVLQSADGVEARAIVTECDRGTKQHLFIYLALTSATLIGFTAKPALDSQRRSLPVRAWYPYNSSESPAYELTYFHQMCAIYLAANLNISKDILVMSLAAQCRCRLRLLSLVLRTPLRHERLSGSRKVAADAQLNSCVREHQDVLATVRELQTCFSEATFAQFNVSLIIICVTAFQLTSQTNNLIQMTSMATYLMVMMEQVFVYCYEGNELAVESENVSRSAYEFPWYECSVRVRRSALLMMTRCCRTAQLTAAGLTTLSLASFMSILKASYTLFTVLRQVNENK